MNHDSDLIAAYAAEHHIDLTILGTAQSGYIETDGE
jgi:hypothetical protein